MSVQTSQATVTREPEHPGYDTLGDADNWGEDYYLLIDGKRIGGTYWCSGSSIKDGERWASYGPAGLQMGFRTREDAEQAQLKAAGIVAAPATTVDVPVEPQSGPTIASDAYDKALAKAEEVGYKHAEDAGLMAGFCASGLQYAVGAVSPRLVWEGAQKSGMTTLELCRLAGKDPMAVEALQWL